MRPRTLLLLPLLVPAVSSCHDGNPTAPVGPTGSETLRLQGNLTGGGGGDALAASLWLSVGGAVARNTQPVFAMLDGALAREMQFRADAHLEASAFASGGPRLEGSERIRRLAVAPGAPADANGNGTNLDETLARDFGQLAAMAPIAVPSVHPLLFHAGDRTADYAAPLGNARRNEYSRLATTPVGSGVLRTDHIGHAIFARALLASPLLSVSRGDNPGATPEEGLRGLLLMQQAVSADETVMRNLFYDGVTMGRIADPGTYDPRTQTPKWLPAEFTVVDEAAIPGAPATYLPHDPDSSLSVLAAVLRAASELAWIGSNNNRNPTLRDILNGKPFGPVPPAVPPLTISPLTLSPTALRATTATPVPFNWNDHIFPLLTAAGCLACHGVPGPPSLTFQGGYSLSTYELALNQPGFSGLPAVVPGDHLQSLMYLVVEGSMIPPTPMAPVQVTKMPWSEPGFPRPPGLDLDPGEISQIRRWIDDGAPKEAPRSQEVGAVGEDLAVVLMRNLEGMHLDPATGALHDRHDGTAPNGFAAARSTGEALLALVGYADAFPTDPQATLVMGQVVDYALAQLTDAAGFARAEVDIATGASGAEADLRGYASLTAGLFAAGRALGRDDARTRARLLAGALLARFFDAGKGLFRSDLRLQGSRYTPESIAVVLEALREAVADGAVVGVGAAHDTFIGVLRPTLVFSEWDGFGEVLGDGIADTDGNGIPEPALAGPGGRAPVFAGEILEGPAATGTGNEPISWSKHLLPLFRNACVSCHLFGAQRGEYRMDTQALLRTPGESAGAYPLIVPGDPDASLFYRKLAERTPPVGEQMPLELPPLGPSGLALVRQWILEGAKAR